MEQARDGSPIEVYRKLPVGNDADIIAAALSPESTILDLGCGAGRLTHALVARGHQVTAVDESFEMIDHVEGARRIVSTIESLQLDQTFDCVLLASHFVNEPDPATRRAFLDCCRRHVANEGVVIVERYPPHLDLLAMVGKTILIGEVACTVTRAKSNGDFIEAEIEYRIGERAWTQRFGAKPLDDAEIEEALAESGLQLSRWLNESRTWLTAARMSSR